MTDATATVFDTFYKVPMFWHRSFEAITTKEPEAIHYVAAGPWELPCYFRYTPSDLLIVGFHGAVIREKARLPVFHPFRTSRTWPGSILLISDPALELSPQLRLAWYRGTAEYDLELDLLRVVRHVQQICKAKHIVFTGSSGGGFAAMRLSYQFPQSLAVVCSPQTNILKYDPVFVQDFLEVCFPGANTNDPQILQRFSLLDQYRENNENWIYYLINTGDGFHIERHMTPFANLFGLDASGGISSNGRVHILLEDYGQPGHVAPTMPVFTDHLNKIITVWKNELSLNPQT